MFRRFSVNFAIFSIFFDATLMAFSLWLSSTLRPLFNSWSFVQKIPLPVNNPLVLYIVFPVIWVLVLMIFSVYDGRKNLRIVDELGSLTLGSALAAISMAGVLYFSYRDVSRFLFFTFWLLALFLLTVWRMVMRFIFRKELLGNVAQRKVLILGAGTVGHRLGEEIHLHPNLGLVLSGYLDDDPAKLNPEKRVLGTLDRVREVVTQYKIDDVVVALPLSAHERLNQMVAELHDLPVRVWVIPDYFSFSLHKATVEEFAGIPMLDLRAPALSEYQRMVKRAFDLLLCVLLLPFALPVIGMIAIAIKLDTAGPVFYRAVRAGENGRLFNMLKFRTMVENADRMLTAVMYYDDEGHLMYKRKNDPRVTRVGAFLRHTSLDEVPQIFNVLVGDMSLVGPRPEIPELVEKYELWQRKRFAVPQGMTGWWQVNGRSDKPMHLNTQDDLYYVQHYSIWLDLQILVKTVWTVLRGRGAF
jgi:exopolysaccharide biosynthesis polyprenyl glycosylphosphotransferase